MDISSWIITAIGYIYLLYRIFVYKDEIEELKKQLKDSEKDSEKSSEKDLIKENIYLRLENRNLNHIIIDLRDKIKELKGEK